MRVRSSAIKGAWVDVWVVDGAEDVVGGAVEGGFADVVGGWDDWVASLVGGCVLDDWAETRSTPEVVTLVWTLSWVRPVISCKWECFL